jgi:hypothetical protein
MEYLAHRIFTGGRYQWICLADTINKQIDCVFYEPCLKNNRDRLWCLYCDDGNSDICTVHNTLTREIKGTTDDR